MAATARPSARHQAQWRFSARRHAATPVRRMAMRPKFSCCRLTAEKHCGRLGAIKMRIPEIMVLCLALGGCAAPRQEVAGRRGEQFIGQNVDALVAQLGPATSSSKMKDGQNSYVWRISTRTDVRTQTGSGGLYGDGNTPSSAISDTARSCKISVIASPAGIVTQLDAEDSDDDTDAMSICARRLR